MIENLSLEEKAALLSGKTVWDSRDVPRLGIRSLVLTDGPHGVRRQTGSADHLGIAASLPATCFPTAAAVANTWDIELVQEIGAALGAEATAQGVDVLLGPGLNIKRSPLCGRNFEYLSEDPHLAGHLAAAYVRGIQGAGPAACPKHFAVNSQELRRMTNDSVVDERTLREIYLTAFEIVVREGRPATVMSSYNKVNGTYAHENAFLLQQVLRDEWGFDGPVVSDWGGGDDPVAAVRAGGTLEMPSPGMDSALRILEAVRRGELTEAELDVRVAEMLALVERSGPARVGTYDDAAHHALARRAAAASVVLLKNDDALLPLAPATRIAIVGDFAFVPRYQGAGSSQVNPTRVTDLVTALGTSTLDVVATARGFRRDGGADEALLTEAVAAARGADVVVAHLGLDELSEIEGRDRTDLRLPAAQLELLAALHDTGVPVVVVLAAGSVVEMPWLEAATAVVHGFLGGQAGAEGMADVLVGQVNPAGRLAESYPVRLADVPNVAYYPGDGPTAEYREGLYIGYRYYASADVPVTFPFGFGLSYTTFAYDELEVTPDGVTFTLENTGTVAGAEVAQLYVGRAAHDDGVHRPVRELKGFARVSLEPGERRRVRVAFDERTFRHFDTRTGRWEVEGGTWTVAVAANATDLRLVGTLDVVGTVAVGSDAATLPHYAAADVRAVRDDEFEALLGRPIPPATRPVGPLDANDPLAALGHAANPLGRLAYRVLVALMARADRKGTPDLNLLFLYGMPFRAIAKMTNGVVSTQMVDALVLAVNGHGFRGLGRFVAAYVRNVRATRALRRELASPGVPH
ncbi:MAG: glycoside hydrolase family 3 C-terminal domain-containing protein [Cellulomonas sp.]|nr:glycoside hydrolase family 3 C-terminal domain-containing protein [Cellulomonas sp.]